jgi:hypothetical protein
MSFVHQIIINPSSPTQCGECEWREWNDREGYFRCSVFGGELKNVGLDPHSQNWKEKI